MFKRKSLAVKFQSKY